MAAKKKRNNTGFGDKWKQIEQMILTYKNKYQDNCTDEQIAAADEAMSQIVKEFMPLFKKYMIMLKTGYINFYDLESKRFVANFIGDQTLKNSMFLPKISSATQNSVSYAFAFVRETYGQLDEDEIMADLQAMFMKLAHRYKPMNRSFCAYVYKAYAYEVARYVKAFIRNPVNIPYRIFNYEDYMTGIEEPVTEDNPFEDKLFQNHLGLPSLSWITGENCSTEFKDLSRLERSILVRYYMEDLTEKDIAQELQVPVAYVTAKRHSALQKVVDALGRDISEVPVRRKYVHRRKQ